MESMRLCADVNFITLSAILPRSCRPKFLVLVLFLLLLKLLLLLYCLLYIKESSLSLRPHPPRPKRSFATDLVGTADVGLAAKT